MDPISDLIIRIKNASAVNKETVAMPVSNLKRIIASVLKEKGFISDFEIKDNSLDIVLKYDDGKSVIHDMKRISKPGRRLYSKTNALKSFKGGLGCRIISTSAGVMTDYEARKRKLGGEVLFEMW